MPLFEVNLIGGHTGDGDGIGVAVFFTFFFTGFLVGFLLGFLLVDAVAAFGVADFEATGLALFLELAFGEGVAAYEEEVKRAIEVKSAIINLIFILCSI
jgi:hypothetical protein